uniref:Variant surface glycoprotein 382 n=1 Tax=Trypanosoma brucei TaxID=5691 RepID=M4SWY2_9TRYP|nr:variant surface glycoprotein 382 [Trypanosoma brucei]
MTAKYISCVAFLLHSVRIVTAAEGDQAADFLPLCESWQAAGRLAVQTYTKPPLPPDLTDILNINMTVASKNWQEIFTSQDATNSWEAFKNKNEAALKGGNWQSMLPMLKEARKETATADTPWMTANAKLLEQRSPTMDRELVKQLADEAFQIYMQTQAYLTIAGRPAHEAIKKKALGARCSDAFPLKAGTTVCTDISGTATTKASKCSVGGAGKGGKSIAGDIVCLCSTDTNDVCVADNENSKNRMGDGNLKADILAEFLKACQKETFISDPARAAESAITAFAARLGAGKARQAAGQVYIGKKHSTDCADSRPACVEYTAFFTNNAKGIGDITWVKNLLTAAQYYKVIEERKKADKAFTEDIKKLKQTLVREFKRRQPQEPTSRQSAITGKPSPHTKEQEEEAEAKCNKIDKQTDCQNPCKWDKEEKDEKKRCTLSKEAKQAAQAGTGAGAEATTGCATHKDKTACENDKTGDKQNCAWRKGKDNEPALDKEMCRNGSFLVNKQLDLTASSFLSLVAF